MEQYQLCMLIVVFVLHSFLGETYKITAYHEVSVQPLETRRSIFTEFKHDLSDSSLRDSSYSTRVNNVEDYSEKQSKGLLNSLLGGGSKGEGGSEEESGQATGSGVGVGGFQGGGGVGGGGLLGGGLIGGLLGGGGGGLTGLLTPALSILGRTRSQMSNEELRNNHMISDCGDYCGEDAALKSPMSDSADIRDSKSRRFRKKEDMDEWKIEDQGNLVDVESDVLKGNDYQLLKKESTQCLQCENDEYAFNNKAFNDANDIADLDTSIVRSRSNINKDSGIPNDIDTETNTEQVVRLRLKRQLDDVGPLVDANVSVLDSGKQSGGNNAGDESSTPTKRRRSIESRSPEEDTSESVAIEKEIRYKDSLETEGKGLEPVMDKKMGNVCDMDDINANSKISERVGIQEEEHKESSENGGKSNEIVGSNEMDHIDGRGTGEKPSINVGSRQMDNEERTEYGDMSSKNKESEEIDYTDELNIGGKSSENVGIREKYNQKEIDSKDMSRENLEKKEENHIASIETESKSSENKGSKELNHIDRVQTGEKISGNVGSIKMGNQEETKSGDMGSENKESKEIDYTDGVEIGRKSSTNLGSREKDNQKEVDSEDMSRDNLERKEENHADSIETESKGSGNKGSKEIDYMDRVKTGELISGNVESILAFLMDCQKETKSKGFVVNSSGKLENKDKYTVYWNSVVPSGKSSGDEGISQLDSKESEDMSNENIDNKDLDSMDTVETGDESSDNGGSRKMDVKETESGEISMENVENKEMGTGTDNSYTVETSGKSCDSTGSSQSVSNKSRDMNSENVKDKEMSLMDSIETGTNSGGYEGNREIVSENDEYKRRGIADIKEAGAPVGSEEVSNTDFVERERSKTSGSKEVDISENPYITDQTKDSDGFNMSDGLEEIDSSGNVGAKDSSNSINSNVSDESNQMSENTNSFEEDEDSNSAMDDYKGSEETHSLSENIGDFRHDSSSSSSEEYSNYFEHDFDLEYPETSGSKEEKSDDLRIAENGSKESGEDTGKGSRYRFYTPFPYSLKYNFDDIYSPAIHGMYRPFMYRYHPRPFLFKKRLSNAPFKRSVPSAQAKQLEMPFLNRFPSSVASSNLYGSYANAQSSPFFGGGIGLGEEEPILDQEEEVAELGKR